MSAEARAAGMIAYELARLRKEELGESELRRRWCEANGKYIEHVTEGNGDPANGQAIMTHYVQRQALFMLAQERGISVQVM